MPCYIWLPERHSEAVAGGEESVNKMNNYHQSIILIIVMIKEFLIKILNNSKHH